MGMSRWIVAGLALASVMGGCANGLKDENALLLEENQSLRAQLSDRNTALESATNAAREREMEAARLRRDLEESRRASRPPTAHPAALGTGFEGIAGVTGTAGAGEITATLDSDVLFDSGRTTLKPAAKQSLNLVANVLNSTYAGRTIRIAGHTDSDPIRRSGFKSNHHLGFERAFAVREYLVERGVAANRIHLASFGPDRPQGNKAQSRRVEVVVVMNQ
jgi:chemotaxis protein MotB